MDLLDRVAGPGGLLLRDVDTVLDRCGMPTGHPIVGLLRSVGARPSAVLVAVAAFDPDAVTAAADRVKATARSVSAAIDEVPLPTASAGAAAEHFAGAWRNLSGQISGGTALSDGDCLVGRLTATADHLAALAKWVLDARHGLAMEVGTCLGSSEAVLLRSATTPATAAAASAASGAAASAAADIGARILAVAARVADSGWRLHAAAGDLATDVPLRPYDIATATEQAHIEIR